VTQAQLTEPLVSCLIVVVLWEESLNSDGQQFHKFLHFLSVAISIGKTSFFMIYYPLANEVAKGYSNATVRPSFHPSVTSL
jgi:hypothetical protein